MCVCVRMCVCVYICVCVCVCVCIYIYIYIYIYIILWITCLPILISPYPSATSLIRYVGWIELMKAAALSYSSTNLHSSCLSFVHSYFNPLIHVQFADQSSFVPALIWSSLDGQMPSTSLWSKHIVFHLAPKFVLILFPASHLHPKFLFLFSIQTDLQLHPQFSIQSLSIPTTIVAACAIRLIVQFLLHFVAFAFSRQSFWVQWNLWVTVQFNMCCWSVVQ